mgnify:CR=1 FL=1
MSGIVIHAEEKFRLRGAIRIVNLSEADIHALFPSAPGLPRCYQRVIDMIADPFAEGSDALFHALGRRLKQRSHPHGTWGDSDQDRGLCHPWSRSEATHTGRSHPRGTWGDSDQDRGLCHPWWSAGARWVPQRGSVESLI